MFYKYSNSIYNNNYLSPLLADLFLAELHTEPFTQRKFIDSKKTKLFYFRWNWDEEIKLRGVRLQISSPSPPWKAPPNLSPICLGGGEEFGRYYYCGENSLERDK
jgi:hypothetical protein